MLEEPVQLMLYSCSLEQTQAPEGLKCTSGKGVCVTCPQSSPELAGSLLHR